jgi:hypothetical protein
VLTKTLEIIAQDPTGRCIPGVVPKPGSPNRSFYQCVAAFGAIEFLLSSKEFSRKEVQEVAERKVGRGLDFGGLRRAIERCDPDLLLGFYSEDAELSIVHAESPGSIPFELWGKAEIAKHLRAAFGQETSHRAEREVVGKDRVTFWEECEYPDGSRVVVATTLEVHDGKIVRQVDLVANDVRDFSEGASGKSPPTRQSHPNRHLGTDVSPSERFLRSKQATEKEDHR